MVERTVPAASRKHSFPSTPVFLFLWIPTGFVLGTLTLLGPVRWWASACRSHHWSSHVESGGVFLMIFMLIIFSGFAARIITNVMESSGIVMRVLIPVVVLGIAGAAIVAWMHPEVMSASMGPEEQAARFTFGPYPTESRMKKLKEQGYTIVSLLHPAVVPFEPKLLEEEKVMAAKVGIPLIHVPMLPWISQNAEALKTIKKLAADEKHRYYVHCYLGKDRVQIVKRIVEQSGAPMTVESLTERRALNDMLSFERGTIYRLGSDIYLTGYPTDEEWAGFVLSGQVHQVVALLDPNDPDDSERIKRERELLQQYDMPFAVVATDKQRFDPQRVLDGVRRVKRMRKPVLVHSFFSPSTGRSPWGDGFIQTFFSDRPSLPPTLFEKPLRDGQAEVVTAHVAIGPRPGGAEFRELARRGVAEVVHVGSDAIGGDATYASNAGMRWISTTPDKIVETVRTGGPFYVYGGDTEDLTEALQAAYGKPRQIRKR